MAKKDRPNILIFMMDTQGARNMSCYGYHRKTTPNIDAIARDGVLFENHFVTSPWTLPVHASIFTGRYESGHGAGAQHEGLEPGLITLGDVLNKNGYKTVMFCNNGWAMEPGPLDTARGIAEEIRYGGLPPVPPYIPSDKPEERDQGSMKAVGVARQWMEKNAGKKPFFMFINCTEPHDPYLPPEPFRSRFLTEGIPYEKAVKLKGNQVDSTIGKRCETFREWEIQRSLVDGETACLDHRIGLLYEAMGEMGLLDNTLFMVTGDHGDTLGEHHLHAYHSQNGVWDSVCKTPLVASLPGVFSGGKRVKQLAQPTDIFPTLLDLLGLKEPKARESIQGGSLIKALKKPIREFALMEAQTPKHVMRRIWGTYPDYDVRKMNYALKAARTLKYKYIWDSRGFDLLFDIVKDPDEQWDISAEKPTVVKKLQKQMEGFLMSIEQRYYIDMYRPGRANLDPKAIRRLAAWGLYQPGVVTPWDGD
ncbi:MAG: sulfatase [Planctomycetes bacterium]|nr:sulfatase [Planctomycetota bacterium]